MYQDSEYFLWICDKISPNVLYYTHEYTKLLEKLHSTKFIYLNKMDANRALDGIYLRRLYCIENGLGDSIFDMMRVELGPASILEMMVALANRCEEQIMGNPLYGDRTSYWFWEMINSLGLDIYTDNNYREELVEYKLSKFLNREYSPDGVGGLFTVPNPPMDMREAEIWWQLNWYLNTIPDDE